MRTLAWIGLAALALAGTHSLVYACDHSAKAKAKATAFVISTDTRTLSVSVPTPAPVTAAGCESVVFEALKAIEAEMPAPPSPRVYHFVATGKQAEPSHPVVRTARAAMTLGRAIKTTVEAVMGSLVSAAAEKTAEIV